MTHTIKLFVSPDGRNNWSGRRPDPNRRRTDGPLATVAAALKVARGLRGGRGGRRELRIVLRDGKHYLKAPVRIRPVDSGLPKRTELTRAADDPASPLTIAAYPGETPVLSGGRRIAGWHETSVNGRTAWVASLPEVKRGAWNFRQLWVNGKRRYRPCLPQQGRYRMAGAAGRLSLKDVAYDRGADRFRYVPGDLCPEWRNLQDVEILFNNFWIDQRMGIRRLDPRRRLAILDRPTHTRLVDESWPDDADLAAFLGHYRVENVFEALERPGEWYLDRPAGRLYYLPLPGEDLRAAEVVAPRLEQVLRIEGGAFGKDPVRDVRFEGIAFSHTEWRLPAGSATAGCQAACEATGAVHVGHAHTVDFDCCAITHVGGYGLECDEGARDIGLSRCEIADTGAGGVKLWHGSARAAIADCRIHDGGRVHESGVGVLIGRSSGNRVLHNAIYDFGYSGVSVGWDWSDGDGQAYGNVIEHNHVYNIGRGELSDLGGIYTLGVAPGTRLRHNRIHDVRCRTHYAWGIYLDACSGFLLVENNVVFRTNEGVLMLNQSRGHEIRNNIFAFGAVDQIWTGQWRENRAELERNLYFVAGGKRPEFGAPLGHPRQTRRPRGMSLRRWQQRGLDAGSRVGDPKFRDPEHGDFRLAPDSPALALGFVPFDLEDVGPRADGEGKSR